ncbi:MAG: ArsR/SmtB family transcription factor [Sedimentitalea sp.]
MTDAIQPCFRALADPTRRDIVRLLAHQDMTVAQLTNRFDMTRAAVKKHLVVLSDGGLIETRKQGRERINTLRPEGLTPLLNWLEFFDSFWNERLLKLKSAVEGNT